MSAKLGADRKRLFEEWAPTKCGADGVRSCPTANGPRCEKIIPPTGTHRVTSRMTMRVAGYTGGERTAC